MSKVYNKSKERIERAENTECRRCRGVGQVFKEDEPCFVCNGRGRVFKSIMGSGWLRRLYEPIDKSFLY